MSIKLIEEKEQVLFVEDWQIFYLIHSNGTQLG